MINYENVLKQQNSDRNKGRRGTGLSILRMRVIEELQGGWELMAGDGKIDARNLWLPVTVVLAIIGGVWLGGRMYERISTRAEATVSLAEQLEEVNGQLSEMKGRLDTLLTMQGQLANVSSNVGSMESRQDAFEMRLQTMDAWVQSTRELLKEQGMNPPQYKPRPSGPN